MTETTLTRRSLALAIAATPLAGLAQAQPALTTADLALADRAAQYLQGLTEARGRFVQTDARGQVSQGSLFLKRPGKARFAYDPPSGLLVVSDGNIVSVADARLKTFDKYPLSATPLSLFLARTIRLDRNVRVTRVTRSPGGFSVTARDAGKQTSGALTLDFRDQPMALAGWAVTDAQGRVTRVRLSGLSPASGLDKSLFVLKDTRQVNPGRGKV